MTTASTLSREIWQHPLLCACAILLSESKGHQHYPAPVTAAFQVWDSIQALSSYIRGMLSSQAILKGVGVGQQVNSSSFLRIFCTCTADGCSHCLACLLQAATPLSAVFQFFLRDLTGMLGGMLFAFWQVCTH